MIGALLQGVVMAMGAAISLLCAVGLFVPVQLVSAVKAAWAHQAAIYLAVIIRLAVGLLLVFVASQSRFPLAFELFGWIAVVAALLVPVVGRQRIDQFIGWWERRSPFSVRLWSLVGLVFGVFLMYGVT
jgi:hypothetical protein